MDAKAFLKIGLDGLDRNLGRVTDGLKQEEIAWKPTYGANSIGLILFHVFKSEDSFIQERLQGKQSLWESGKWYEKLNMPKDEAGAHYTAEQVNAFPVPKLDDLLAYGVAVRNETKAYIESISADDFDEIISMQPFGDMPKAFLLSLTVSHAAGHLGEMSYIRGLQRGLDG
ncbi:MAG TPA: DinB family protein [Dehalococcoidia bacterium]|nr:DinB family protein [Dehalococcoidia bacterium]